MHVTRYVPCPHTHLVMDGFSVRLSDGASREHNVACARTSGLQTSYIRSSHDKLRQYIPSTAFTASFRQVYCRPTDQLSHIRQVHLNQEGVHEAD